jgi:hypothetical protein
VVRTLFHALVKHRPENHGGLEINPYGRPVVEKRNARNNGNTRRQGHPIRRKRSC